MAFPLLVLLFLTVPFSSKSQPLSLDYYSKTCPDFQKIIRETVHIKQTASPVTAAGTLRLFFHDCMVEGCDASVLITSNAFHNSTERDHEINHSLPGDAFDVLVRAKTALELTCPGVISCSDVLAQATRDLITMVGGPFYKVPLGRKDALASHSLPVESNLPRVNQSVDNMIKLFESKGFSVKDLVALSGGHTIGFSHCKEFADRLFHYNKTTQTDPEMYPSYAYGLKKLCANYLNDSGLAAFNDIMTPGKFDNLYFQNILKGLGLLTSDHVLGKDTRTRPLVELYAANQTAFFNDFTAAMEKLSVLGVKTGDKGEVRRKCDVFNSLKPQNKEL